MDFARVHNNATNVQAAHGLEDGPFLHWHRWFLWKYEQALQFVSGTCVTVPYWDWTMDSGKESQSTVLQPESFGSTTGVNTTDRCVIEGIANKNGFWSKTAKGDPCVKRCVYMRISMYQHLSFVCCVAQSPSRLFYQGLQCLKHPFLFRGRRDSPDYEFPEVRMKVEHVAMTSWSSDCASPDRPPPVALFFL